MTVRICDSCGKQIRYTDGYTLHVCFDMETVLEKDVCKDCRKRLMLDMNVLFGKEEEKHVGN